MRVRVRVRAMVQRKALPAARPRPRRCRLSDPERLPVRSAFVYPPEVSPPKEVTPQASAIGSVPVTELVLASDSTLVRVRGKERPQRRFALAAAP